MPIRLGQLEIHAELNEICGPAGRQRLEPQAVTVLELLACEPGRVWSRDDILDQAWKGRVVSDATLTGVISRLRRALSDVGIEDVGIETRSKRGYVLVLSNEPSSSPDPRRSWWFRPAALASVILLAGLAAALLPDLFQPKLESLDGVRLDFNITFPDGMKSEPMLWLEAGGEGEIRLSGEQPLNLRVMPMLAGDDLLRLRIEASGLSHWTGFEQVIGLDTESRFTLRASELGKAYDIRFIASRDDPPSIPQEIRR